MFRGDHSIREELVNVKRNKALTVVRAVQSVASALLIGFIFLQLERNMSSLSPRLFSSFLLVFAQFLFALLGVVNAFPAERAVFLRETQDKLYHPAAFYLAKVSIDTLMQCLFPILVVAISYPLIGFNGESADRVLWFYAIMAVVSNCGAGVGFMVSAAVPSVNLALSIAPGLIMPQLLLSGIFIKVPGIPGSAEGKNPVSFCRILEVLTSPSGGGFAAALQCPELSHGRPVCRPSYRNSAQLCKVLLWGWCRWSVCPVVGEGF